MSKNLQQVLAAWVREELAAKGWKPADLTRATDISEGEISRILNDKVSPRVNTIEKIAIALGYDWAERFPRFAQSCRLTPEQASHLFSYLSFLGSKFSE